ncbi:MAG: carboxypeptidase-like regulatory domain-containing protein [Eudoraea sp.]|nr:carboxypeptidase-like regulatory domain-containing protein [Eudoraea sp.]
MKKVLFFLCSLGIFISYAQDNGTIRGNILDLEMNNEPLIFAHVQLQNTNISTQTNFHGNFELSNLKPGKYNLVIRYLGYETRIIPITLNESERKQIIEGLVAKKLDFEDIHPDLVTKDAPAEGKYGERKKP